MTSITRLATRVARIGLQVAFATALTAALAADEPDAKAIVDAADRIRFPGEGFQVDVSIASVAPDKDSETRKYRILSKGNENTIVIVTEPTSDKGQILLMKNRDLWMFLPDISQPVRLSLNQRLTGEVANGDLARANFSGDYTPKWLRTETIDNETYHVLELNAVDRGVTYHRVVYWVRRSDSRPLKAEFYSLSDRLLKTCHYQNYQKMAGQMRPTRLVMDDALKANEQSILEYSAMRLRELPDKMFTKDYLKKLD